MFNPYTGQLYVVGSKAADSPNLEKRASLLQWAENQEKLERCQGDTKGKADG